MHLLLVQIGEIRLRAAVVDPQQDLALIDNIAFPHHDVGEDTAFEILDELNLARRYDAGLAARHLVQHRMIRPDQEDDDKGRHGVEKYMAKKPEPFAVHIGRVDPVALRCIAHDSAPMASPRQRGL